MSLTYVTSYLNYYHTPLEANTHRLRLEKLIHFTSVPLLIFTTVEHIPYLHPFSSNQVKIIPLVGTFFEASILYRMAKMVNPTHLPEKRNIPKDTFDYMCFLHSKIEFMRQAVKMNPFHTTHFAWIDSNISHMFSCITTCREYLHCLSKQHLGQSFLPPQEFQETKIVPTIHQIYMPGCWNLEKSSDYTKQINWRFCGAFFLGHGNAILHLWKLYEEHFMEFLKTTDTMVWDVNFWAWLEACKGWEPIWYKADHNDSIIRVPIFSHSRILSHFVSEQQQYPSYPLIEGYFPSAISYLEWEEKGKTHRILNTRFVNYEYLPSGHCTIHHPERQVYTKNMCYRYDEEDGQMMEENPLFMGLCDVGGMFHGLEDIRLFYSKNKIQFLATTVGYSPSGKNRMVLGTYDFLKYQLRDCVLLEPPTDTFREKNWIPFLPRKEEELFIYSWTPIFQIGEIKSNRLEITRQMPFSHPLIPHEIRGSSNFVWTQTGYVGVVHFSIPDTLPRQYYHLLVCLDLDSYLPISYSDIFCFEKLGIEFCISLTITNDQYMFWFSQQDRDPMYMCVDLSHFTFFPLPSPIS